MISKQQVVVAILLLAASRFDARAETTYWSASSGACAAGDPAIQNDEMEIVSGSVRHKSTKTGLITMYCSIAPNSGGDATPARAWMTYKTDGAGSVEATGYKKDTATGTITQLYSITSGDSDNIATEGYQIPVAYTLDFNSYYYYVRVDIDRTNTSPDVASFYGVRIGDS